MRSCEKLLVLIVIVPALAMAEDPPAKDMAELTKAERDVVDRTNAERRKAGLTPLTVDTTLMKLAREHSAHMARLNRLSHELEGKPFGKRMQASGYRYSGAGENVAQGQRTPEAALASWMNSPGHKANILNAKFTHFGVGLATSQSGEPYYTQVFATPLPPSPAAPK